MVRSFFFLFCALSCCILLQAQEKRFTFTRPKMGAPFTIVLYAADEARAAALAGLAFARVDSFVSVLSDYDPGSEVNRLCATAGTGRYVPVSPLLWQVLAESRKAWNDSRGLFDVTAGPVTRLWRAARKAQRLPDPDEVAAALGRTGMEKLKLDRANQSVQLTVSGMQLDFGGIGQGLIAGEVIRLLQDSGIASALVNATGDIVCSGPPPGKEGWSVAINLPGEADRAWSPTLVLKNGAVTTSGDVFQYLEHNGVRYGHIVDPRTGYGVTHRRNVTVRARRGTDADWLATACSLLPLRQARKLARKYRAGLMVAEAAPGGLKTFQNRRFRKAWRKEPAGGPPSLNN
ncbi:MAG TPA: FAD:protein FMN transferase [Chitinophagaceae bacterium]|nr:FAD:protein FMN transferase [Chitinophagaceae bacterium]